MRFLPEFCRQKLKLSGFFLYKNLFSCYIIRRRLTGAFLRHIPAEAPSGDDIFSEEGRQRDAAVPLQEIAAGAALLRCVMSVRGNGSQNRKADAAYGGLISGRSVLKVGDQNKPESGQRRSGSGLALALRLLPGGHAKGGASKALGQRFFCRRPFRQCMKFHRPSEESGGLYFQEAYDVPALHF